MSAALLLVITLTGTFDAGGRVAGVFPVGSLTRHHQSSSQLGAFVAFSTGRMRYELGYDHAGFGGLQGSPYRLTLHQTTGTIGYRVVGTADWGLEAQAGGGYGFALREFGDGVEEGGLGIGRLGFGFTQNSGNGRLFLGLVHSLLVEIPAGTPTRISAGQVLAVQAGVSYVF